MRIFLVLSLAVAACSSSPCGTSDCYQGNPDGGFELPAAVCKAAAGGGTAKTAAPTLLTTLKDRFHEAWLASPAVIDLDGDNEKEIVIARAGRLLVWRPNGEIKWSVDLPGRTWSSPLVANFVGDSKLEVVTGTSDSIYMHDAAGKAVGGFPVKWRNEIRSIAAGDIDGDGQLEIVAMTTNPLDANNARDIILAVRANGQVQAGWPPNTSGASGCTPGPCYVTGGYDQNVAIGPIDDDSKADILVGQDNAYMSWHRGTGEVFSSNAIFNKRPKVPGIRFMFDYRLAQQGFADNEAIDEQAHFTNSAPAIADIDGDGHNELVVLGSVQNAAQDDRLRGVGLWAINPDGTRPAAWVKPFQAHSYLAGLWDYDGVNIVAATNQVSVGDLDPNVAGLDMVFAGFDGRIHLVGADNKERWSYIYTTSDRVLTGGVLIGDLSGDGIPEIIFNTYSPDADRSALFILNAAGQLEQRITLPAHGAMPVPTVEDVNGDGTLEIVVSLKDGEDKVRSALVYTVAGSSNNCLDWPTGRGNYLRNGYFRRAN